MPYGARERAQTLQIREDLKVLTTDQMIFKYNYENYHTLKRQNGILGPPPVTKREKKERMNTEYGRPTPPSETTACDLWGVRLPYFKQYEMHNVNERFRQSLYGPKRRARKPKRAVTEREVMTAKSRPALLETAKRAAAGLTPPESEASSVPPMPAPIATAMPDAVAEPAAEATGVLRGTGRKRIPEEEVVRTREPESESADLPNPEQPTRANQPAPEARRCPYGGPPPRRGPNANRSRLRAEPRREHADIANLQGR